MVGSCWAGPDVEDYARVKLHEKIKKLKKEIKKLKKKNKKLKKGKVNGRIWNSGLTD